jgi:hypothetical protein
MKKPVLDHLSPTVLATFATAIAISLSGFLLAGAGGQVEPAPLLPAIGGAAGHVIAELPAAAHAHARKPAGRASVGRTAFSADFATTSTRVGGSPRRAGVSKAHRVHRPDRFVRHPAPAPAQPATRPAPRPAPAAPVVTRQLTSAHKPRGKALGHSHSHARSVRAPVTTSAHGHGKAHGHHGGLPPGHAKKAPAAPAPAPAAPAKSTGGGPPPDHGGGNEHREDKK